VGWTVFIVLTAALVSPFIPGKILDNFPGSSQSDSSGEQSIACINTPQYGKQTTAYNLKLGAPIVYKYTQTTTLHATCDGKPQSVTGGQSSQFNPVGLAADVTLALIVAVVIAKIWRKLFGIKEHY
jgi:hypothetical protein